MSFRHFDDICCPSIECDFGSDADLANWPSDIDLSDSSFEQHMANSSVSALEHHSSSSDDRRGYKSGERCQIEVAIVPRVAGGKERRAVAAASKERRD
jgi:hypothetical protein